MAGNFSVSPIRLDFDAQTKSGLLTITNMNKSELRAQIRLLAWTQDASGKDQYTASEELLYFPRLMTVAPGEQRVVRAGLRGTQKLAQEKAYRLFVEEIPASASADAPPGAHLAIAIRFGAPLFVHPEKEAATGLVESLTLSDGVLRVKVRNTGNVHFKIDTIEASAGTLFSDKVAGWYVLPGAAREYEIPVPAESCGKLGRINVRVNTDKLVLESALNSSAPMCKP